MKLGDFILSILENDKFYGPILTILISYLVYRIIHSVVSHIITMGQKTGYLEKKRRTVITLITNIIKYVIIIIAGVIILNIYGVDTTSIVASLGVASAVIGLAFQDVLKDLIGGATIIMENYFIVGDYIRYGDFTGEVVSFGLKSTKVKNANNEVLTIANRNVSEVINLSQNKAKVFVSIPVAYEENTDKVEEAISEVVKELNKDKIIIQGTPTYLGVDELADSSVNYLICFQTQHDKQWQAKRDALKIIKNIFDRDNVKIPYNQIEVHNG